MSRIDALSAQQAADFAAQGATLPLTSPTLAGARVRRREDAMEVLHPGRAPCRWDDAATLRTLTVHDMRLLNRVRRLRCIPPGTVREACCETLAEGFAGRRAMAAAAAAMEADREARLRTHYHVVLSLAGTAPRAAHCNPQAQMVQALQRLTGLCNAAQEQVAGALTQLSALLAPVGLGESIGSARLPTALSALQGFRRAAESLAIESDADEAAAALITRSADISLACLTSALAEARALAANVPELARAWLAAPEATAARLGRAEWLADGWGWLCQAWAQAAEHDARPLGLDSILRLLPALPAELTAWPGFPGGSVPARATRSPDLNGTGRLDAIARNETIMACSL